VITVGGFNTSIDKTLEIERLQPGAVHRARRAQSWPGGKGLHVALTIAALGERVRLVGLIDARHRREFEETLRARGVEFLAVPVEGALRTCLALRDEGGGVTEILEPGPQTDADTRDALAARFLGSARGSAVAILSGSLPPGFADTAYGDLVARLRGQRVRCLVDASGALLRHAVGAGPLLVKPNRDEAEALTGEKVDGVAAAVRVVRSLVERGVERPIVSLGAEGAVMAGDGAVWHGRVGVAQSGHAVGSGDCLLGGVAVALKRGAGASDVLRLGVACGAANTLTPETGWLRREDVDTLLPQVTVAAVA
jgi:tagatose 6-phosphate kinase